MITKTQYVILTVSDSEGIIVKYSATVDNKNKYKDTETFLSRNTLEGIVVTTYDNLEDFKDALACYKSTNAEYIECLYN